MVESIKEIFLSATYVDQIDCIEEVKSKLAELGVKPYHFKEGQFYNGQMDKHSHDRCIELVEKINNYLLIVNYKAGNSYEGTQDEYRGLTITHAEFRAAIKDKERKKVFAFVRRKVWDFYKQWKTPIKEGRKPNSWEIDEKLVPLLEDLENNMPWTDTFDTSLDLKQLISAKRDYFI
ncbi:MAG: DUF4062 domain-containing protein [Promethearchaeota archaeon]